MKSDRNLKRKAASEHLRVHRRFFLPAIVALAGMLAVMSVCIIALKLGLAENYSARHFAVLALVCSSLALSGGVSLVTIVFGALSLEVRNFVDAASFAAADAAKSKAKKIKSLLVGAIGRFERLLAFLHRFSAALAWRLTEAAGGLSHDCLTPRILAQRPICTRVPRG